MSEVVPRIMDGELVEPPGELLSTDSTRSTQAAHGLWRRPASLLPPLEVRVGLAAILWAFAYWELEPVAGWLTYGLFRLPHGTQLAGAVDFFLTDVPKIFLLLSAIVTAITFIRSYFPPERVKKMLAGK